MTSYTVGTCTTDKRTSWKETCPLNPLTVVALSAKPEGDMRRVLIFRTHLIVV